MHKHIPTLFLVVFINFLCCTGLFAQEAITCATGKAKLAQQLISLKNTAPDNVPFTVKHLEARWEVNPNVNRIDGSVRYTINFKETTNKFVFNLHNKHNISAVTVNGESFSTTDGGNNKRVLTKNFEANTNYEILISYGGAPRVNGGFTIRNHDDSEPVLWTLSEPYDAQDWWPVPQQLNYKIDRLDIYITYPENLRSASNGLLVESTYAGGKRTDHWQHKHPINYYLIAIAVTNYIEYTFDVDLINNRKLPIQNLLYPELFASQKADLDRTGLVMRILDSLLIPYPFQNEKYGHAHFGFGGGMEHQTMSFMQNFSYDLLAHEAAHQWFGDYVTCGSWQDLWLNESFATYLNGASYEPWSTFYYRNFFDAPYRNAIKTPGEKVFVDDTTNINRLFSGELTYYRGAMVIRTLRYQMSDNDFWAALRLYLNQNADGFARTKDLVQVFNSVTGKNWDGFFQNFIYTEGYPLVDVYYDIQGNKLLGHSIERINSAGIKVNYAIDFPVKVLFQNGDSTTVNFNTGHSEETLYQFNQDIERVEIDPYHFVLAKLTAYEQVLSLDEISVFPNPSTSGLFSIGLELQTSLQGTVYSSNGKKIITLDVSKGKVDLSAFPSGKYYLELSLNGKNYQIPLLRL